MRRRMEGVGGRVLVFIAQKNRRECCPPVFVKVRCGLLGEEVVAALLDGLGDGALVTGAEARVFARQDLAGVRDKAAHQLGAGERNFLRLEGLGLGFGRAHV